MAATRGMPALDIMQKTERPHDSNGELGDDQAGADTNGQSRGGLPGRRRRAAAGGKISGRKFQLPDSIFERLQLHAIKRRSNPSAVLTDILDRELPKHKIATDE